MSNSIVVNPTVVDEIEFYVSIDGKYTGMSQRGLALLCGVHHSTIQELVSKIGVTGSRLHETLKALPNKLFWQKVEAGNKAEVIPSEVCAAIITYYAFESKAANDTAKFTLAKFASTGIQTWIKQITGYAEQNNNDQILACLHQMMGDIAELKETSKAYHTLKGTTVSVFPNLNRMLDDLEVQNEFNEIEPDVKEMTATEWLKSKGITFDSPQKRRFALLLSETYKSTVGKDPKKVIRVGKDGKKNNGVSVYHWTEFPILQLCLNKMLFEGTI